MGTIPTPVAKTGEAQIRCENVLLIDATLRFKGEQVKFDELRGEYHLEFSFGSNIPRPGELDAFVGVQCINKKYPDAVTAIFKVVGKFTGKDEDLRKLLHNCLAILLPYLRTYVSTITALSPVGQLLLPVLNVSAILQSQQQPKAELAQQQTPQS